MSARRLGRLAGLVFVLAAILGGVGANHTASDSATAVNPTTMVIDWL
jgi:hypothetical protein